MARTRFQAAKAEAWLRERLADGEPRIAGTLIEAAFEQEGIKERTLQLARQSIGATTEYRYIDGQSAWYWQLKPS